MVVNPVTLTSQIHEINGVKAQEKEKETGIVDKVSISPQAREIQEKRVESKELAKKVISSTPDVRISKISEAVERVKNQVVSEEEVLNVVAQRIARIMGVG